MSTTAFTQTKDQEAIIADLTSDVAPDKKQEARTYQVLQRVPGQSPSAPHSWLEVATVEAASTEQAIRKTVEQQPSKDDTGSAAFYVAVPSRSLVPVSVSVKTTTQIILK
jgi:hypothetical protein